MDAIVAERLTASPRTFDMYAFCGLTIISEFFPYGDLEDAAVPHGNGYRKTNDRTELLNPHNSLTAIEKLSVATQMAESIADLHGYASYCVGWPVLILYFYVCIRSRRIIYF